MKQYNSTNIPFRNYINIQIELIDFYATNDKVCKVPTHSLSAWPLDMILLRPAGSALAERSCASWTNQRAAITGHVSVHVIG